MSTHVLGIMVSQEQLRAVLVEPTEEGPAIRAYFARSFGSSSDAPPDFSDVDDPMEGFGEEEDDDFTIQFGSDGGSGGEMFLGSEFEGLSDQGEKAGSDAFSATTFEFELEQILDECRARGFGTPRIAFCTTASEMDELELRLPPDEGTRGSEEATGLPLPAKRKTLLAMVEEQYDGNAEDERVAFVPMQPTEDGRHRVLALIARRTGCVLATLREMSNLSSVEMPDVELFDAEITTYLGLARSALDVPLDANEKTLIVRTGTEDTLVLFMKGNTLLQAETLPSLTVRDPAETICSRVLLLQDEYGIGEIQHVFLIGEEGDVALIDGFQDFFPDADVNGLRQFMPHTEDDGAGGYVAATGAALRLLGASDFVPSFQDVNFLPKSYTRSSFSVPVGWSVPVLLVLLFAMSLGFVWYYLHNLSDIREQQNELRQLEQQVAGVDKNAVRARIDSLNAVAQKFSQGMVVIDTLLQGSNKWSKGLAHVATQTDSVEGLWVEVWNPQDEEQVKVAGYSTARMRVVRFAERLNGEILSLSFTEIRDWPLYSFELDVPLDTTMPRAAQYWRQEQLARLQQSSRSSVSGTSAGREEQSPPTASVTMNGASASEPSEPASEPTDSSESAPEPTKDSTTTTSDAGKWTIVIAAPLDKAKATTTASAYRDTLDGERFPIEIRQSPTNGRYLVSVSTFPTLTAAKVVLQRMKTTLPDGTWLYKIPAEATSERAES